jgi:hypothetical protein
MWSFLTGVSAEVIEQSEVLVRGPASNPEPWISTEW